MIFPKNLLTLRDFLGNVVVILGGVMYFRTSTIKGITYLLLVESYRENGKVKQKTIASFGRLEEAINSGALERLLISGERFAEKLVLLSEAKQDDISHFTHKNIGISLVFNRIWSDFGIDNIIKALSLGRKYGFSMERVLFAAVIQRLARPDSDRAGVKWLETNQFDGGEDIRLQHLYRAMKWLGEPLEPEEALQVEEGNEPSGPETPVVKRAKSVRRVKDLIEEEIYGRRHDLFTRLDLVFFDTTSIYFEGEGGTELGKHGHSKDHRPDLNQVVVGMVLDNFGWPICTEVWPGNTADVTTLVPVAERLKERFQINNVCVVSDRGIISKDTIKAILELKWSYILGARMRREIELRAVIEDSGPYEEVRPEREKKSDPAPLKVKEVIVNDSRYIVCINEEEARKDRYDRDTIIKSLKEALKKGSKVLIGNKGYKRYIKASKGSFEIDESKILEDAKYDGMFVLKTNLSLPAAEIALKYKQLLTVETIFRTTKSTLHTRPIYHHRDESICGHIWCSFLALLLRKAIMDALQKERKEADPPVEWKDVIAALESLTISRLKVREKSFDLRSDAQPLAVKAFRALGIRLPDRIKFVQTEEAENI